MKLNHPVQNIGMFYWNWFCIYLCICLLRSTQTIIAEVPQFSSVLPTMPWIQRSISTPISFVRRDGVIYLTPLVFTYTPEPAAIRKSSSTNTMLPSTTDSNFCE